MSRSLMRDVLGAVVLAALCAATPANGTEIGQIKVAKGEVTIERKDRPCADGPARACRHPTT